MTKKVKHLADGDEGTPCLTAQIAAEAERERRREMDNHMCECGFESGHCHWPACGTFGRNI